MKFVNNARSAWKWFSVQILALIIFVTAIWDQLPPDVQSQIPEEYRGPIVSTLAVLGLIGRLIKQPAAQ